MNKFALIKAENTEFCLKKTINEESDPMISLCFDVFEGIEVELNYGYKSREKRDKEFSMMMDKPRLIKIRNKIAQKLAKEMNDE